MKWEKIAVKPIDITETEIVFRDYTGKKFVEYINWDTKITPDKTYYEYLDESEEK